MNGDFPLTCQVQKNLLISMSIIIFFFKFFFISIEGAMKQWSVWTSIGLTD